MTEPCERFQKYVVTKSGVTAEDPLGWLSTIYDYVEWRELAWSMLEKSEKLIAQLHGEVGQTQWSGKWLALSARYKAQPIPIYIFGVPACNACEDSDTLESVAIAVAAACLIGEADQDLVNLGKAPENALRGTDPPETSDTLGQTLDKAKGKGTNLVLLFLAWQFLKRDK